MTAEKSQTQAELKRLLDDALATGESAPLENYLVDHSNLPGTRMNLPLVETFAALVGKLVLPPGPVFPIEKLESLLDGWAALDLNSAPVNQPREILPACAVRSYAQVALVKHDWWEDETAKLHKAASDPRWRTREIVASSIQKLLAHDWPKTFAVLNDWLSTNDPLVIRAVVGAIAEPPLLKTPDRAADALAIQQKAIAWFEKIPKSRRKEADVRTLRQALGYTLSVAVAADLAKGWTWLQGLAGSADPDVAWIVRENLKKDRLKKLAAGE